MKWTDSIISEIREEINALPHGQRKQRVEEWAEAMGCSPATVWRKISTGQKKCPREPEVHPNVIFQLIAIKSKSETAGVTGRTLSTEDAIAQLVERGVIKEGDISVSNADRRMRQLGYNAPRVYNRHEDDYVNQVHMIDFSRSEYFSLLDHQNGDYILKIDGRRGSWAYKNKPKAERLRLWVACYIDTVSRAAVFRYYAATGENLMLATRFLSFVWQRKDSLHPLQHLPETLKLDQGAVGKNATFRNRIQQNLGIRLELAAPKNDRLAHNQSMGKVERQFRTLWQRFELDAMMRLQQMGHETITLGDLNTLVHQYAVERLARQHPNRAQKIGDIYRTGIRMKPQRKIQTDIFALLYSEDTRVVKATADVQIENELYKVPEQYVMQKIRIYTTPDGELRGSSMDGKDTFDLVAFDPAGSKGIKRPDLTIKQKGAQTELQGDPSKISIIPPRQAERNEAERSEVEAPASGAKSKATIKTLPARESSIEADTPFRRESKPADAFTDWHQCRKYICKSFACRWTDFNVQAQGIFNEMFQTGKLTREIIDGLAQTAS